jgi:hypothetical protein
MENAMTEHRLAPTTHTIELEQIHEINAALAVGRRRVTAGALGMGSPVSADSALGSLDVEGPPSYPYIYGHFDDRATGAAVRVEIHTAQLQAISHELLLSAHVWGV